MIILMTMMKKKTRINHDVVTLMAWMTSKNNLNVYLENKSEVGTELYSQAFLPGKVYRIFAGSWLLAESVTWSWTGKQAIMFIAAPRRLPACRCFGFIGFSPGATFGGIPGFSPRAIFAGVVVTAVFAFGQTGQRCVPRRRRPVELTRVQWQHVVIIDVHVGEAFEAIRLLRRLAIESDWWGQSGGCLLGEVCSEYRVETGVLFRQFLLLTNCAGNTGKQRWKLKRNRI